MAEEALAAMMQSLGLAPPSSDFQAEKEPVLKSCDLEGVIDYIRANDCRNIVVMSGAGISTSAGIPDFRTPGTGLYDNLQKYNLPEPTAIFELGFFLSTPEPFFELAKELYPGVHSPTISHAFVKLLEEKDVLLRNYTQNIDTLERAAGVSADKLVEAHGSFASAHCTSCTAPYDQDWVKVKVFNDEIPKCDKSDCDGTVKPDIVFFGESLPERFHMCTKDLKKCDLLIIMGTSLKVQPFCTLIDMVDEKVPRLLINREKVGETNLMMRMMGAGDGMNFDDKVRDVALLGTCDNGAHLFAKAMGWESDLRDICAKIGRELPDDPDKAIYTEEEEEEEVDANAEKVEKEDEEPTQQATDMPDNTTANSILAGVPNEYASESTEANTVSNGEVSQTPTTNT